MKPNFLFCVTIALVVTLSCFGEDVQLVLVRWVRCCRRRKGQGQGQASRLVLRKAFDITVTSSVFKYFKQESQFSEIVAFSNRNSQVFHFYP